MRKGWWKPYISGAVGAGLGIARGVVESGGNPIGLVGALKHGVTGATQGYALHETIRNKYSVPWMGRTKIGYKTGGNMSSLAASGHKAGPKGPGRSTPRMGKKKSRKRK